MAIVIELVSLRSIEIALIETKVTFNLINRYMHKKPNVEIHR